MSAFIFKKIIKNLIFKNTLFGRLAVSFCANRNKIPDILCSMNSAELRSLFFLPSGCGTSQLNQDIFALLVNRFQKGYFIEIGANDGFNLSNTLYLESEWKWDGLLVEANPKYVESLNKRQANKEIAAVMERPGDCIFVDAGLYGGVEDHLDGVHKDKTDNGNRIKVMGKTFTDILRNNNVPAIVNFISIDVEGAELPIVKQLCNQNDHRFVCGAIEHNYRQEDNLEMKRLLDIAGYAVVWESSTQHDLFFVDPLLAGTS